MGQTADEKAWIKEGLAAYVGISAPETPKYLLANNFLLDYFEVPAEANREYHYETFDKEETLYTEDTVDTDRLQQSFNKFLNRYLGEDIIREENRRLNENKHYYFPITQSMLPSRILEKILILKKCRVYWSIISFMTTQGLVIL